MRAITPSFLRERRPGVLSAVLWIAAMLLGGPGTRAQSLGPQSPGEGSNDAAIGSNPWSNIGQCVTSDNTYSSVATKGISNYLRVANFGFALPAPSGVAGIQLDVERSSLGPSNVSLLDAWTTGLTRTVSAGANRCLVVTHVQENGLNARDLTAMTYGTRAMTQMIEFQAGVPGGFTARIEVWMLLDAELALASNTTIVPTFGSYTPQEYCELFTSAVFEHVDQLAPVLSQQSSGAQSNVDPHQLAAAFSTIAGSMAIQLATCGNRDSSAPAANTNTSSYATPAGYTEGIDHYFANAAAAPTSGASFQVIHKSIATDGSEQPACDFNGTVNRWAIVGFDLQRARELDHSVMLVKGGVIGGADLANTATWPTGDAYVSYGGPTSLWGTTWSDADINASTFGAAVASRVQNGTALVDHMRITVWFYSTLPVELIDFRAQRDGGAVGLDWLTATETNNDHFVVQRSRDGSTFEDLAQIPGAGNSVHVLHYTARDEHPLPGVSYYRLMQVDNDGTTSFSPVRAVEITFEDELIVSPNPSGDGVFTIHDAGLTHGQVAVFDEGMHLVRVHVGAGSDPIIHLGDLPDGIYMLLVEDAGRMRMARAVKTSRSR